LLRESTNGADVHLAQMPATIYRKIKEFGIA
jgi:hypothetical protein